MKRFLILQICICIAACPLLNAQSKSTPSPSIPQVSELRQITRQSGAIFAGRVISVQYLRPRFSNEVPTMRITFRIERGIRGARTGSRFVLREWAALWNSGERYRVGERVLLFLYPPSKVGLTSPVAGARGRFQVDSKGQVILNAERARLFEEARAVGWNRTPGAKMYISLREVNRVVRRLGGEE
jgi:hypothetical protein